MGRLKPAPTYAMSAGRLKPAPTYRRLTVVGPAEAGPYVRECEPDAVSGRLKPAPTYAIVRRLTVVRAG